MINADNLLPLFNNNLQCSRSALCVMFAPKLWKMQASAFHRDRIAQKLVYVRIVAQKDLDKNAKHDTIKDIYCNGMHCGLLGPKINSGSSDLLPVNYNEVIFDRR